jgi:hypothetical protein
MIGLELKITSGTKSRGTEALIYPTTPFSRKCNELLLRQVFWLVLLTSFLPGYPPVASD